MSTVERKLPIIVDGSRLRTIFKPNLLIHLYPPKNGEGRPRKEYWKTERRLGGGSYGTVYLQKCSKGHIDSNVRALKIIPTDRCGGIDWIRELETIIEFSHHVCEEYFVKSFGWFQDRSNTFISMEYMEHGDLEEYLKHSPIISEEESKEICFQLICGLRYMHGKNFAHRDLKPGNIMIKAKPPGRWWIKLGDFGLSKRIEATLGIDTTVKGTPAFMAPELHDAIPQNRTLIDAKPADMWSLGEILFKMLTGKPAFEPRRALWHYVDGYQSLPVGVLEERNCSQDVILLYSGLMERLPKDRPTAETAYHHDWLANLRLPPSPGLSSIDVDPGLQSPGTESVPLVLHELWNHTEDMSCSGSWTQATTAHKSDQMSIPNEARGLHVATSTGIVPSLKMNLSPNSTHRHYDTTEIGPVGRAASTEPTLHTGERLQSPQRPLGLPRMALAPPPIYPSQLYRHDGSYRFPAPKSMFIDPPTAKNDLLLMRYKHEHPPDHISKPSNGPTDIKTQALQRSLAALPSSERNQNYVDDTGQQQLRPKRHHLVHNCFDEAASPPKSGPVQSNSNGFGSMRTRLQALDSVSILSDAQ
ncbi:hypothetical protein TWF696_005577 [Orbilia brochopaga]|uniref:Autophagy-related protein 1 n=1 Tax=Orbilia brochopaga TaxID=3140254 RepID=A0AAV9V2G3_9PEZI